MLGKNTASHQSSPIDPDHLFECIAKQDDYKALEQLFKIYYKQLCIYALKYIRKPELCEEAVSDVFTRIWSNRKTILISCSIKSYLYISVRNQCIDLIRKRSLDTHLPVEELRYEAADASYAASAGIETAELAEVLETGIANLSPQCKVIFKLSREEGMKYKDIADKLDISIKTVETQMGRALKSLRTHVNSRLPFHL
jgi:RNA polymerase sigma-70 factor (ECF subfamily)